MALSIMRSSQVFSFQSQESPVDKGKRKMNTMSNNDMESSKMRLYLCMLSAYSLCPRWLDMSNERVCDMLRTNR